MINNHGFRHKRMHRTKMSKEFDKFIFVGKYIKFDGNPIIPILCFADPKSRNDDCSKGSCPKPAFVYFIDSHEYHILLQSLENSLVSIKQHRIKVRSLHQQNPNIRSVSNMVGVWNFAIEKGLWVWVKHIAKCTHKVDIQCEMAWQECCAAAAAIIAKRKLQTRCVKSPRHFVVNGLRMSI